MVYEWDMVEKAFHVAEEAHKGQVDKAGKPYIEHPMMVAGFCSTNKEKICAYLHDTVEDTHITLNDIREMFGEEIAEVIDCLTHRKDEIYADYLKRCKSNETARVVKCADLTHNMMLCRLKKVTNADIQREEKYEVSKLYLES